MKKSLMFAASVLAALWVHARSEVVGDVTWYYEIGQTWNSSTQLYENYAYITSGTDCYSGDLTVPSVLGSCAVTSIGNSAFYRCTGLTSVTIPNSVTSIGGSAFSGCTGLTSVTIPNSVTSIEGYAFSGCTGLTSVTIPSSVTSIRYDAFYGCTGLKSVTIPSSVTSIGYEAFYGCTGLTSVTIPNSVTSIGYDAFYGCTGLKSVTIPNSVTSIGDGAFYVCTGLTSVTIPNSVTSIGGSAFSGCTGLTSVTIPNSVTSIGGYAFSGCTGLTSVTIPNSVTSIGGSAFYGCTALTEFFIPASVESFGTRVVGGCDNLTTITVDSGNTSMKVENGCLVSYSGTTLLEVPFGCEAIEIPAAVTTIPSYMFSGNANLKRVTIPNSVTSIGGSAFYGCTGLTSVTIPSSVTSIGNSAFYISKVCRVVCEGAPPSGVSNSGLLSYGDLTWSREYGAEWLALVGGINKFQGFNQSGRPEVEYVSIASRTGDPTILDVVFKVKSAKSTVKVRALAFQDGARSFAKVVRPETFVDGTAANVGDAVAANVELRLSWKVPNDWAIDLAKVSFEVLAMDEGLLPLELVTIPAGDGRKAMEISWNAINSDLVFNALLWLYADKTPGMTLEDGVLWGGAIRLVNGASLNTSNPVTEYVFSKMGFYQLSGENLAYAKDRTDLPLSPSGVRQYAYRWVE